MPASVRGTNCKVANKTSNLSILTGTIKLQPHTSSPGAQVLRLHFLLFHWPIQPSAAISRSFSCPKAATIPELSTRRKSICLPPTHVAHPSLQVLARLSVCREGLEEEEADRCRPAKERLKKRRSD